MNTNHTAESMSLGKRVSLAAVGTIGAGDGGICVGYEIDRGCHQPV
jgi:hypothetical protein